MRIIGKIICDVRKSKGLTQEQLAEASKVNLRTIQRIENHESEPRGKTLQLICEVLDIKIEDILNNVKEKSENNTNPNSFFGYEIASKGTRFLASFVEFLIVFAVILIPIVFYVIITKDLNLSKPSTFTNIIYPLLMGGIFYPLFSGNLGHKIFNLKVISSETGENYNKAADGAIREFLKYMLGYLIIPALWIFWDDKNQTLYDKLTKTYIVTNRK